MPGILEAFSLSGRRAVVTGGSRGIGAGIALALAEAGADFLLVARGDCSEAAAAVKATGRRAECASIDLGERDSSAAVLKAAHDAFGGADILVNNAGVDPESCSDVLIEDTYFDTGDDCIAIKAGRNNDGRWVATPSENIIVRNCVMKDGHGVVVLGSECSGGIRNVFIENCEMDSPNLDRALRFKNNAVRGGVLEAVFLRNVTIGRVAEAVLTIDLLYEEGAKGAHMPIVRNVQLENTTSNASLRVMWILGFSGAIIDGIVVKNSTFKGVDSPEVLSDTGSVRFENVTIEPRQRTRGANSIPAPANTP